MLSYAQYFPAILEAVQAGVALAEAPGKSATEKLADAVPVVRDAIIRILPANHTAAEVAALLALAEPLINAAVAVYNKPGGLFNPAPAPLPVPVLPPAPPVETVESIQHHITHMEQRLATVTDSAQIANITRNLEAEKAKLAALQAK